MAIKSANDLEFTSRKIALSWMIVSLAGAIATGLAGAMYFSDAPLNNPESVFIFLSKAMFSLGCRRTYRRYSIGHREYHRFNYSFVPAS